MEVGRPRANASHDRYATGPCLSEPLFLPCSCKAPPGATLDPGRRSWCSSRSPCQRVAARIATRLTVRERRRQFPTPMATSLSMSRTPTPPSAEQFLRALNAKLPDPSSCLFVAEHEGQLVGYVSRYCHPTFYAGGPTAWVDELLVSEPRRRTGIGRQLMDAFEQWAQDRRCVLVSLATRGAVAFYERRGYSRRLATTRDTWRLTLPDEVPCKSAATDRRS